MSELEKNIGGKKYVVFGPNAIILKWARRSDLAQSVYAGTGLTEDMLIRALCAINHDDMHIHAKKSINKLWHAYPELGPYPFLDTLSDFEFNRQFFPAYREHVIHQLRVFLTGLYLFDLCGPIRTKILEDIGGGKAGEAEFVRRWTACAVFHDIGYILENEAANEPDGDAWLKTRDVMNQCLAAPLFSIFGGKEIPEHVERKIIEDQEIFRPKIDYMKKLEFHKNTDLLDLIADFGTLAGLGSDEGPGKSPLRSYYSYAFSHDKVRPRFRDHGIASALLLLRLWSDFRDYIGKYAAVGKDSIPGNISQDLTSIQSRMTDCQHSVVAAAGAVALHNINASLWDRGDAYNEGLTLHSFEIRLSGQTALAFLLGLSDTLQDWDRPRFRAVSESDKPILDQRDMRFCSENGKIRLWFQTDDEIYRNPAKVPESRFSKMKEDMAAYLDRRAVEELLEWGECDSGRDNSAEKKEIPEPEITHEPKTEPKEMETKTVTTEPENTDDLIYIISAPGDIETARKLYADLEAEGLNPWMESEDLDGGGNMKTVVKKHIKISKYVLALISKNASTAKGFAQRELKIALDEFEEFPPDNIYLIPVKLDNHEIYHSQLDELKPVNLHESYLDGFQRILKVVGKSRKKKPRQAVSSQSTTTQSPGIAEQIEEIENLYIQTQYREAYEKFFDLCKSDSKYRNQAISVLTQFNDFENQVVRGLLSVSDQRIIKQQISSSFLNVFDRFKRDKEALEEHGYTPPSPTIGDLHSPDRDERIKNRRNFEKFWNRVFSFVHGRGWKCHTDQHGIELYIDPLNNPDIKGKIFVSATKPGRNVFIIKVAPRENVAEKIYDNLKHVSESGEFGAKTKLIEKTKEIEIESNLNRIIGHSENTSEEEIEEKLYSYVTGYLKVL